MVAESVQPRSPDGDERFIRTLVERIRTGGCVLLLGPGVAVEDSSLERTPVTTLLARKLASDPAIQGKCPSDMEGNLRYVAQLHYEIKHDLEDLGIVTQDFFRGLKGVTTRFHRNLAQLPFRLCVNTSPDEFMLQGFRETPGKQPNAAHYNFRKAVGQSVRTPTEAEPLVYYLYGRREDLSSLVLTESDLIEFLVAVVRGDPSLPDYLCGRLGDPDTTFLFVGFGFQNWYLRVLLHVLKIYGHKSRAVALEDTGFFAHPERPQTVGFFSGDRLIEFRELQWHTFAERLCAAYRSTLAATPARIAPAPGVDAPKAFLCYASEDREAVTTFGEALQAKGVAVWQDQQNLRTGENWDRVLVDVIKKRVDYIVVAQSPQMANRLEGYFRKEIEVALDRFSKFDKDFLLLLPVTLQDGKPLPELAHLHTGIDITSDEGVDRLARTILEDWAKPKRHSMVSSIAA